MILKATSPIKQKFFHFFRNTKLLSIRNCDIETMKYKNIYVAATSQHIGKDYIYFRDSFSFHEKRPQSGIL